MIRVEDLTVFRGETAVVGGVDFELGEGRILVVIGPNGCGKTTLLEGLRARLRSSGTVEIAGERVDALSRREIARRVAVAAQNDEFAFDYRVDELVSMGRAPHRPLASGPNRDDMARTSEALETLDLVHLRHRSVRQLSGGERRRVVLARALCQDTPVLFLDEPTSGLDPGVRAEILTRIVALAENGKTIVAVLHDVDAALEIADDVIALGPDGVVHHGKPDSIDVEILRSIYGGHWRRIVDSEGRPHFLPPLATEGKR